MSKTISFEALLRQEKQAKTHQELLKEFLELVKKVGMKEYQLTIIQDSVTLEVLLHEQHLIPKLMKRLLDCSKVRTLPFTLL